jgi:hypothetical protein
LLDTERFRALDTRGRWTLDRSPVGCPTPRLEWAPIGTGALTGQSSARPEELTSRGKRKPAAGERSRTGVARLKRPWSRARGWPRGGWPLGASSPPNGESPPRAFARGSQVSSGPGQPLIAAERSPAMLKTCSTGPAFASPREPSRATLSVPALQASKRNAEQARRCVSGASDPWQCFVSRVILRVSKWPLPIVLTSCSPVALGSAARGARVGCPWRSGRLPLALGFTAHRSPRSPRGWPRAPLRVAAPLPQDLSLSRYCT